MKEQEEYIWNEIINILARNPDIFPITKFLIDANKQNYIDEKWIKYQLKTFCNIQTTFYKYYKALSLFWNMSDDSFKESFNKNVIINVLFHYKDVSFSDKEIDERFKEIINALK